MSGGVTPLSLNLSTRRERSISRPVHLPPGKVISFPLNMGLFGATISLDAVENIEVSCFYRESNHPNRSHVTMATTQTERAVYSKESTEHTTEDSDE